MLLELQQQSNDLLFVNESWPPHRKNGPLDRFWTVFRQTIGDPAQFFLSQLADLEVVSLLLHKTNRAEQRQLDSPPLAGELWTGPQSASPKGTVMCTTFYLFIFF